MKIGPGDLVKIDFKKHTSPENLMLAPADSNSSITLYEKIDLSSYPGYNDFHGKSVIVKDGDIGMILSYVDRPFIITQHDTGQFAIYDVFEIMIAGAVYQVFGNNIKYVL